MTRVAQASSRSPAAEPPAAAPRGCSHFKLRQTERLVSRFYNHQVASAGVTTPQYSLLSHLATLGPMRPADLAARMGLTPSTLSRKGHRTRSKGCRPAAARWAALSEESGSCSRWIQPMTFCGCGWPGRSRR